MANASRIALAWVTVVVVLIVVAVCLTVVDPQIEIWATLLVERLPNTQLTSNIIIAVWRMSMLISAMGVIIWACLQSIASETDSYDAYGGM